MRLPVINAVLVFLLWISGSVSVQSQGTRVDFSAIPKSGTILVYSHQDDDLIWMLPFWRITEKFIEGAMPASPTYRTIISQQQTFLNNNDYNISYQNNWYTPWDDVTDTEYSQYYLAANTSYNYLQNDHLETRLYNNTTELSRNEINKIKAKLEQFFADQSMRRVITHNNWGEYGHQHHKGINKAVRELAVKYRKDVWMLGCDNGGFIDVSVPNGITYTYGSFNTPDLFLGIRAIYVNNNRWTWYTDRVPSGDHKFIKIVDGGSDKSNILKGDAITYPGTAQLEPGAYIFDGDDDYLTLRGNNYSSFTITMRIRPDQIREMDISAMSEYPLSTKNDRNLYLTGDGHIRARINDGASRTMTSTAAISAGTWSLIAITGNGSSLKLYINGLPDKTITTGKAITNYATPEFILGQATMTSSYFRGQINNVSFYNRALSDNEIAQLSGTRSYIITSSAGTGGTITPSGSVSVRSGSSSSFNIRANQGYEIADVKIDNSSAGAVSSYTFSNITANHKIAASFRPLSYSITAEAGSGGKISPAGAITVNYGAKQTFSINADVGFRIAEVKIDNVSVGSVSEYTFDDITSSHTIKASFTPIIFNIRSDAGPGGTIGPSGVTGITYGKDQSYTITPSPGYSIKDVLVDNVSAGPISKYSFKGITSDHTIYASFTPIYYNISSDAGPGGSINPSGAKVFRYGNDQTYTIEPVTGYQINDVLVDNLSAGPVSSYAFRGIASDHKIYASFIPITFTIYGKTGSGGSVTPSGQIKVEYGHDQYFTVTPDYGFKVSGIMIDHFPVPASKEEFVIRNVTSDHNYSVVFSKIPLFKSMNGKEETGTISDRSLSVENADAAEPSIYPNPFRNEFNVLIKSQFDDIYEIYLLSISNRLVYVNSQVQANTIINLKPDIPAGVYILNICLKGRKLSSVRVIKY